MPFQEQFTYITVDDKPKPVKSFEKKQDEWARAAFQCFDTDGR